MQCFSMYSSSDGAPLITFAGSSSHNLSTMFSSTFRCVSSSILRPEPAAEAPHLQSACNESTAPLKNVIPMKLASRLRFVQRRDAAPMRCGDATAMPRRCDRNTWHCDGDAIAQMAIQPNRNRRQKPAQPEKPVCIQFISE